MWVCTNILWLLVGYLVYYIYIYILAILVNGPDHADKPVTRHHSLPAFVACSLLLITPRNSCRLWWIASSWDPIYRRSGVILRETQWWLVCHQKSSKIMDFVWFCRQILEPPRSSSEKYVFQQEDKSWFMVPKKIPKSNLSLHKKIVSWYLIIINKTIVEFYSNILRFYGISTWGLLELHSQDLATPRLSDERHPARGSGSFYGHHRQQGTALKDGVPP